jgi:hypothetical protein
MTSAQELSLTVGLLYGRKTGMSFELDVFSVCASKDKSFTSSGCKDHQLLVAAAIFPWTRTQLKRESTHSVNESKTIWIRWFSGHRMVSARPTRSDECLLAESPQSRESRSLSIKG